MITHGKGVVLQARQAIVEIVPIGLDAEALKSPVARVETRACGP